MSISALFFYNYSKEIIELKYELKKVQDGLHDMEEFLKVCKKRRDGWKFFFFIIDIIKKNISWILAIIVAILTIIKFFF